MTTTQLDSPLERPHPDHDPQPFFSETLTLLRSVRDHDFDTLAALCDDDFGIIDVDPSGTPVPVRTRAEWEAWFHGLFATLATMGASTDSEILAYDARREDARWATPCWSSASAWTSGRSPRPSTASRRSSGSAPRTGGARRAGTPR